MSFFDTCDYRTIYIPWKQGFGGLTLLSSGYEDFRTRTVNNSYVCRFYYGLHCVLGGKGRVYFRGKEYIVEAGQMFCLPPRERLRYVADEQDPWRYCWFGFVGDRAEDYFSSLGFTVNAFRVFDIRNLEKTKSIFENLLVGISNNTAIDMETARFAYRLLSAFFAFLECEALDVPADETVTLDRNIIHLEELIRKNFQDSNFSFSKDYLPFHMTSNIRADFSKEYGMSPMKYLSQMRIQHAASLLNKGSKKLLIAEIAQMSGYRTTFNFLRAFKTTYGMTPESYRKLHNTR